MHAHPAARGGARDPARLPTPSPRGLSTNIWQVFHEVSDVVSTEPDEPAVRPAPARVLCAGAPGRGLRRDLRRLAAAAGALAEALRRMARAEEARVRGRA